MSWYREGTIGLTNGSVDVTGVGTTFTSEIRFSDILLVGGALYEIARVESDTKLKLTTPFAGATVNGSAYAIIRNLTNASNFELMKKIEEFLTDRQRSMDEFVAWINGLADSGPTGDGVFPLTDRYGVKVLVKCPKRLEADTLALTNRQAELIDQTETTLASAQTQLTAIGNQQAWADQILGYKNAAAASATKASQWAENAENTAVETGKYSAKHHALKAAASATAASGSATAAAASKTGADTAKTGAETAKTAAQTSETNAAASAAAAKTSETNAAASATAASTSASQAATSKTGADTAKTQAETAKSAAQTSETNAAASATAAASSASAASTSANTAKDWAEKTTGAVTGTQYSAKYHATAAQTAKADVETRQSDIITRQADVQTRQADVITRQSNVASLESSALASKNAAATSAATASTKATEAATSATGAATSATNASASEVKAGKWAEEAENVAVETGKYSSKHHALKAAASATAASSSATAANTAKTAAETAKTAAETARTGAQTAETNAVAARNAAQTARDEAVSAAAVMTGALTELGGVDLSSGVYPTKPTTGAFWKVTVAGTVSGVAYGVGDTLVYSKSLDQFYKIDNTESVTSVNGKTGALTLTAADVGALGSTATAAAATKLATARTISVTGDATGSASFDGSANAAITLTLPNSGVVAGTYPKVVVNAKGLVTGGAALTAADIPQLDQNTTGNAGTATKLATARSITLTGDVTGTATFDGSASISITATVADDSHAHVISNVDGLQTALDAKLSLTGGTLTGPITLPTGTILEGTTNGLKITNGTYGTIEIGNRNASWTHYGSSTGNHYFYGNATIQTNLTVGGSVTAASFSGSGAGLTAVPAAQLSGVVPDVNLSGTYTGVSVTGNAGTATKLQTARTLTLAGDVTGAVSFDGSANVTITTTIGDDSHAHVISNVDGLQAALDAKLALAGGSVTGSLVMTASASDATTTLRDSSVLYLRGTYWNGTASANMDWYLRNNMTAASSTGGYLQFVGAGTERMSLSAAGALVVTGNITAYSDVRLKTNIQVIPNALVKVLQLRGVTYDRIDIDGRHTGVIAQEVEQVLPEAVIHGEKYMSVAYGNMVGLLIEAIKELKTEVDDLRAELRRAA